MIVLRCSYTDYRCVVVFIGKCDFSRTSRKGRVFYIPKPADKRLSVHSLSVENDKSLLRTFYIIEYAIEKAHVNKRTPLACR